AAPIAATAAIAVAAIGLRCGTYAASGADAYGYVSQAALWRHGTLRVEQPFAAAIPWPDADSAFAPLGYRRAVTGHAIVPSYAPGLPLLMAVAERGAGACGPYYVVPVFGALCIWCCYLLGARAASPGAGACAAVLLACSPVFLFQLLAPMRDVPAAALWSAALRFPSAGPVRSAAVSDGRGRSRWPDCRSASARAGVCAALAVLVRPNLVPVALVLAVSLMWPERRDISWRSWKCAAPFAVAVVLALTAVAMVNLRLYG